MRSSENGKNARARGEEIVIEIEKKKVKKSTREIESVKTRYMNNVDYSVIVRIVSVVKNINICED